MKASSAKAKGRRCAQELKDLILRYLGTKIEDEDITVTPSGVTGPDLILSPLAKKFLPIAVECKNVEKLNIWAAMEQAETEARVGLPVLFFRRNRSKMYACIEAEHLIKLLAGVK